MKYKLLHIFFSLLPVVIYRVKSPFYDGVPWNYIINDVKLDKLIEGRPIYRSFTFFPPITNPHNKPVNLNCWKLRRNLRFYFPLNTQLERQENISTRFQEGKSQEKNRLATIKCYFLLATVHWVFIIIFQFFFFWHKLGDLSQVNMIFDYTTK